MFELFPKLSTIYFWVPLYSTGGPHKLANSHVLWSLQRNVWWLLQQNFYRTEWSLFLQDSWAIAQKTARCAQYMGALKSFESPHYAPGYFSRNLYWTFVPINTKNVHTKFEVCSCTRSWDNRGYSKNLGSTCIRPRSLFSQIFKGLLFAWTLWIYLPSLKFVALPVPEIIGGTQKIGAVPGYAHAPFSPKILKGFYSNGPCEYTCQIWNL